MNDCFICEDVYAYIRTFTSIKLDDWSRMPAKYDPSLLHQNDSVEKYFARLKMMLHLSYQPRLLIAIITLLLWKWNLITKKAFFTKSTFVNVTKKEYSVNTHICLSVSVQGKKRNLLTG